MPPSGALCMRAPSATVGAERAWRLALLYFLFFAFLGAFIPNWSAYLAQLGLSGVQIGVLWAAANTARVLVPLGWAWLADHWQAHLPIVRVLLGVALLAFALLMQGERFPTLLVGVLVFAAFWDGCLPLFEVVTLRHLRDDAPRYPRLRVWGSLGFIATASGLGWIFGGRVLDAFPYVATGLIGAVFLCSWWVTAPPRADAKPAVVGHASTWLTPSVFWFFVACFFMQASHGGYYGFYTLHLRAYGFSPEAIGALWGLGVLAEVVLFVLLPAMQRERDLLRTFALACALTLLRWTLMACFPDSLFWLVGAQLLHAASFGLYHAMAVQWIHRRFHGATQGRAQALYSSVGFGAGAAVGNLLSGFAWDVGAGVAVFTLGAGLAALAVVCAMRLPGVMSGSGES